MKPVGVGERVNIRVKPQEMMSCVDVCTLAQVDMQGVSLSETVRLALGILIEAARKAEIIPTRDGFEYSTMVEPIRRANIRRKVQVGQTMSFAELKRMSLDMPSAAHAIELSDPSRPSEAEKDLIRKRARDKLAANAAAGSGPIASTIAQRTLARPPVGRGLTLRLAELEFKAKADPTNFGPREQDELTRLRRAAAAKQPE